MKPIKIALLDDHLLFRMGVKQMLQQHPDLFQITLEASCGKEFYDGMKNPDARPDLILLDLRLPHNESGLDVTIWIKDHAPDVKILILSAEHEEVLIGQLIVAGINGFISKNASLDELNSAIILVANGGDYFGKDIAQIICNANPLQLAQRNNFTQRELDIISLATKGLSTKQIADNLNVSIHTINTHKNHIFRKLGINSTVELVNFAVRNKIIAL